MLGFHHIRSRALLAKGEEPFPAQSLGKRLFDYLMYGVGLFAPVALIPQILQVYSTKSSAGLSLSTWLLFIVVNSLWATYGMVHKDMHIFFANVFMALFNGVVVVGILAY